MRKYWYKLLAFLCILNVFDGLATAYTVTAGYAKELNPAMSFILSLSPWLFLFLKIFALPWILFLFRKDFSKGLLWTVIGLITVYGFIDLIHIHNLFFIWFQRFHN